MGSKQYLIDFKTEDADLILKIHSFYLQAFPISAVFILSS